MSWLENGAQGHRSNMELTGSALTAAFIGLIWVLIKVVEFFISKYKNNKEVKGLTNEQVETLRKIHDGCNSLNEASKEHNAMLRKILSYSEHLDHMHSVYNDDHAPAWYMPPDMLKLVRENYNLSKILSRDIEEHMDEFKGDQDVIVNKMTELITSQKLMTERLGDLISALNKISR
jgi:hypothetical protein